MKKLLFYALAAFTVMGASCSKDAEGLDTPVAEGKYTLPAVTASLDDIESRTGLGTNNVVNWSNNDKLAIVNTKTNKIFYYVLSAAPVRRSVSSSRSARLLRSMRSTM